MINYFAATSVINAAFSIVLGLVIFLKKRNNNLNKIFASFCLSATAWAVFYFFWQVAGTNKAEALFFARALNMAAIFVATTYLHLVILLLGIYEKRKKLVISAYLLSIMLFFSGFTPLFVKDVAPEASLPWYPKPGPAFDVFVLMFLGFTLYGWYLMMKGLKDRKGDASSSQIKYVLLGTFVGGIGGASNFLPIYGVQIPPYGNGLVVFYVIFIAFAVLKYHLFEIKLILTEVLVGIMGAALILLPFFASELYFKILTSGIFLLYCFVGYLLIKSTRKEIDAKETLEQKVQERTKELQESKMVAEERAQELEKWYKLTIGREVRMAELKQKIKEMESARKPD